MINYIIIYFFFLTILFYPIYYESISLPTELHDIESNDAKIIDAIDNISPSVVGISVINNDNSVKSIWEIKDGIFYQYKDNYEGVTSLGSGFIFSHDGYIITNTHVVQDAKKIFVTLYGGIKFEAQLTGYDILTDIAVLKINTPDKLPVAKLGNSDDLVIGASVIALGNPLGLFDLSSQPTATKGIISGLNIDFGIKNHNVYRDMIQTDASINSGNSGGPLINANGAVIGVNTFIAIGDKSTAQDVIGSIGFAIPINLVIDIAHLLLTEGEVSRDYNLGLTAKPLTDQTKKAFNVPFSNGIIITDVEKKSEAMLSGLKVGDVILSVDGTQVNSFQDISNINRLNLRQEGDEILLKIWQLKSDSLINLKLKLINHN